VLNDELNKNYGFKVSFYSVKKKEKSMFKISVKIVLAMIVVGLFSVIGCKGHAEPIEGTICGAFQDAMNEVLSPQEFSITGLSDNQIKNVILPSAAKIIVKTVKLVRERTGRTITADDVFISLPTELEEGLDSNREQITLKVEDILKKDK